MLHSVIIDNIHSPRSQKSGIRRFQQQYRTRQRLETKARNPEHITELERGRAASKRSPSMRWSLDKNKFESNVLAKTRSLFEISDNLLVALELRDSFESYTPNT